MISTASKESPSAVIVVAWDGIRLPRNRKSFDNVTLPVYLDYQKQQQANIRGLEIWSEVKKKTDT